MKSSTFFKPPALVQLGAALGRVAQALGVGLVLLAAPAASAQSVAKPAIGSGVPPSVADTARLVTQHTPHGVRFVVRVPGTGPAIQAGSRVAVRYTGFLPDGHIFDATAASGGPLRFRVGRGEVIPGWDELLPLLAAGARVRAWVPAALAYGPAGLRDPDDAKHFLILPNTELVFELHVVSVR